MDWNSGNLQFLSECLLHTLSPNPEPRRKSESSLADLADRPDYGLAVLRLVAEPSIEDQIRQAAAVNFKNHLKRRWSPSTQDQIPMSAPEKEQIKTLIVPLMLSSAPRIQSQLSEALAVIGNHDFPRSWPNLLPELVAKLQSAGEVSDYASVNGVLGTANSLFKKFRYQFKTNDLLIDLKCCLDNFASPLLQIFIRTAVLIDSAAASSSPAATLRPLFESQRLCCRIFYSLNFQDLPEFFEDHMREWMTEFRKYLTLSYPTLEEGGGADGLAAADDVRAAVCENISLYMEKNEEEFAPYLSEFAQAVENLLVTVSTSSRDRLVITALKFLTTLSTSVGHRFFEGDARLLQICQKVIIPNVVLRDEDKELFEMNYIEYIRRDMEGSDLDTRRRISCELLKGIATNYREKVMGIVSGVIQGLLAEYAKNPAANWKYKDCAIYLVVSLATKKAGGANVSTDLVDVQSFFASVIIPELQSQNVNENPMLWAGALKFFTMFRHQLPKHIAIALLPDVIRFIGSDSNVVHSYASSCIEKLLLVEDDCGRARYGAADINPFLLMLMNNLFNALKFPESEENQYVMKCIMRVLAVADISAGVADPCITGLTSIVNDVCRNPKNPIFNHYLFEAVAVLIRRASEKDISVIPAIEAKLFPSLQIILADDVAEFLPYAFQLLAQLVELNTQLPPIYVHVFEILLSPDPWKRHANVPALVRLLRAFLQKAPNEVNREGRLSRVLDIFKKLVESPRTDEQGFYVLNSVVEDLGYDVIATYVGHIWSILFNQLMKSQSARFVRCLLICMSLFVVKHGVANLVDSMTALQADIFLKIVDHFWIPHLKQITGPIEVKLTSVASTRVICESPALLDPAAASLWGRMLDSIVTLFSRPEKDRTEAENDVPDLGETVGYSAAFVRLYNAGKKEDDPLKEVRDPKEFMVLSLANLSALSPGRFPRVISGNLAPENQTALLELCNTYNRYII